MYIYVTIINLVMVFAVRKMKAINTTGYNLGPLATVVSQFIPRLVPHQCPHLPCIVV